MASSRSTYTIAAIFGLLALLGGSSKANAAAPKPKPDPKPDTKPAESPDTDLADRVAELTAVAQEIFDPNAKDDD